MILVDKNIKERSMEIFKSGYNEENVNAISYDIHIQGIVAENELIEKYALNPGEVVFIKTIEEIEVPHDLMIRVAEKNSRMRQGLMVSGPHYYPGHRTYMYLRVYNMSSSKIVVKKNDSIAQLIFEELKEQPDETYNKQANASFNEEDAYKGLGKYKDEYEERIQKVKDTEKNLEGKINNIYVNMITLMGVFVSIFSLIMVNFTTHNSDNYNVKSMVVMNISLGAIIALFIGLLMIFINKANDKKFQCAYIVLTLILVIGVIIGLLVVC